MLESTECDDDGMGTFREIDVDKDIMRTADIKDIVGNNLLLIPDEDGAEARVEATVGLEVVRVEVIKGWHRFIVPLPEATLEPVPGTCW